MNVDKLTHLIYCSAAIPEPTPAGLRAILEAAQRRNAQRSVTGMLLYTSGSFFQVLEGEETTITELFALIVADRRHRNATIIIREPIARRAFGDWTMAFAEIGASELAHIEGMNDFFPGDDLAKLQPGRASKLLAAFAQGRWRARLR